MILSSEGEMRAVRVWISSDESAWDIVKVIEGTREKRAREEKSSQIYHACSEVWV